MLNCPVCKELTLHPVKLESDLPAYHCSKCNGVWIQSNPYLAWRQSQKSDLPVRPASEASLPTWDTQELKLCPDCGRFLMRYKVLPSAGFYLDRCGHCNGVWLDKQEWEALVNRNLHDNLNEFFTQPWQNRVRAEEARQKLDQLYRSRFGEADYARLKEVDGWMREHPRRAMLLAFLQSKDPYLL